ncbi:intein/intein [Murinocardiopsis flavida]|uniref:Intein/intein n=1 Tax=Murinocardiopsis flavida TaxID=645275 RepID=A0A2P8CSX1_9ACTN|nr:polymorphic toxin-type HINT domain-containing protein [Murinocardiopsis flavida]PSK88050.1 intein/intein [Murinocardiopsis flavida]
MRWVWRADSGAGSLEYGALVVLSAAIVAALISAGLPTAVTPAVSAAVCELYDAAHCDPAKGGPDGSASKPDDQGGPGEPGDPAAPGQGDPSGGGDPDAPGDPDGGGGDPDAAGDPDEAGQGDPAAPDGGTSQAGNNAAVDPDLDKKIEDAQKEYDDLLKDADEKKSGAGKIDKLLLDLLKELIGYNDAKKCFTEGDVVACLSTALEVIPWTKAAKFVSKIPKAYKLFDKWRKGSKAYDKVKKQLADQKKKLDDLKKKREEQKKKKEPEPTSCPMPQAGGKKPNSFVPGTQVLLADGSTLPIEEIAVGDEVLAFDPRTGKEGPRPVTDLIEGSGKKTLVTITVTDDSGATGTVTATDEHPFWSPEDAEWLDAEDLRPGDRLRTAEGEWAEVRATATRTSPDRDVYNLTIADLHTYYVGRGSGLLTHNDERCPEIVLDKFDKFEQARNKALDLLGEIDPATRKPLYGRLETATSTYGKKTGFTTRVNGVYKEFRMDYDPKKGPHINIMVGKGKTAKKYAVPWEGTEDEFAKLLKNNT